MNSKGLAQLAYEKGMYVLTAAQSYQAAREVSRLGHGLLTYALIEEGLKRAKADTEPRDGQILIREWFGFAAEQVPRLQLEEMIKAQGNKPVKLRFLEEEDSSDPKQMSVQRPRMFYRREIERTPLIMARVEKAN